LKVKTVIVAMILATTIVSPSNAGNWAKIERPCGSKMHSPAAYTVTPNNDNTELDIS
jgi:hypothetical protein